MRSDNGVLTYTSRDLDVSGDEFKMSSPTEEEIIDP
jgi:hypothetical protein